MHITLFLKFSFISQVPQYEYTLDVGGGRLCGVMYGGPRGIPPRGTRGATASSARAYARADCSSGL